MTEKFYITTAIDYVNGVPHIGHAYEKIATDVLARHFKQRGKDVFFLSGTDEHGIKIEKTAAEKGINPQEFTDEIAAQFQECWKLLDIDYDRFIRTTEPDHVKVVQHIFKTLTEKGDIYKASYTGLYCNGCESFLSPRDLDDEGRCVHHLAKPIEVQEENYFFKLSKYKDAIIERIQNNPRFVMPDYRQNEIINQLKDIEDISVSRSKSSVTWGIPVPDDDTQVIYVWIDALSNYLTGAGYLTNEESYKKYWPASVHMIGKDILKFHSIYWIGILMAMDLPLPETIFAHGWITVNEAKMGKSLGNVIKPAQILEEFNLEKSDVFRYFMMTTTPFGRDGNYSDEDFKSKVNADIANNLGNLLNRTLNMLVKYFDGNIIPEIITGEENNQLASSCKDTIVKLKNAFDDYKINDAAEIIISLVDSANKYLNDKSPWTLAKNPENMNLCGSILYDVLETLRIASVLISPFIPNLSQEIWTQLSLEGNASSVKIDDIAWGGLKAGFVASKETIKPIFLRLDSEIAGAEKKK
ncbi:MAG: methionine--tRNA ligase [bacterium]